jgi:hypothetical protein
MSCGGRIHFVVGTAALSLALAMAAPRAAPGVTAAPAQAASTRAPPPEPDRFAGRAGRYFRMIWGIDRINLRRVESGELIRFTYRVLDAAKAAPLQDKQAEPVLIDPAAGVRLAVPTLEKVGALRETEEAEAGKSFWIAFSNKGLKVKHGAHVSVVIGEFRADGLVVD